MFKRNYAIFLDESSFLFGIAFKKIKIKKFQYKNFNKLFDKKLLSLIDGDQL